ncbi:MAG: dehypoxanthine futalosine cyclase [Nitrospiraceae bacterium]|nr:dehypoxanthine futalosine cyclase [Nitrospiraceae bacterium]
MRINKGKALKLLESADLLELGQLADGMRKKLHPKKVVTFVVDRNINYTNVCINGCKFCAFWRPEGSPEGYVISKEELASKIEETIALGGTQILLQGGLNPQLPMGFYTGMLAGIKRAFPSIRIHGFSPPEIEFIARQNHITIREALGILRAAGLDSVPGGGAEILSDRVRKKISPEKIGAKQWLNVMREAHRAGMRTTATMMFGASESAEDIIAHLDAVRALQDETGGFTAFIPWSFQPGNTKMGGIAPATGVDYLRVLAVCRIYLDNIKNIQASWVTQGLKMAQVALRFGANDFGSTMIEENVVASAGVKYRVSKDDIIHGIKAAGFRPAQRDTLYNILKYF